MSVSKADLLRQVLAPHMPSVVHLDNGATEVVPPDGIVIRIYPDGLELWSIPSLLDMYGEALPDDCSELAAQSPCPIYESLRAQDPTDNNGWTRNAFDQWKQEGLIT